MTQRVFAANWKMNLGPSEARAYMGQFLSRYVPGDDRKVLFFPPALSLGTVAESVKDHAGIGVGIQNIWHEDRGAFTGESSAPMAKDAGAHYVLVGHSERRHVFGETDAMTAKKCEAAVRNGLTPLLCVGELLEEREMDMTNDVVIRQLRVGIFDLSPDVVASMAIAYEPVWAIGTGRNATPTNASTVHAVLREALREVVGDRADQIPILYGGSVNGKNAGDLLAAPGVNGLLVGGASLDAEGWASICAT